tara:strand:- start:297 stop:416 length:120 start_codon:yes stop_codon:yes gene_type:complete
LKYALNTKLDMKHKSMYSRLLLVTATVVVVDVDVDVDVD